MFTIAGKKGGIIWDVENNCRLAHFKDGVFQTEDKAVAKKLKALGYEVEGDLADDEAKIKPLDKMSEKALRAYAAEKGIDLGDATKKPEILAAITAAESSDESKTADE